jgi:RNase P protein component
MPSIDPILSTLPSESFRLTSERPLATAPEASDLMAVAARAKSGDRKDHDPKRSPRRFPSAVQTTHFKAFWVKAAEGVGAEPDLVQTVIPKRLLKKAVDRNGLRRVLREAVRAAFKAGQARLESVGAERPTARVVLTSAKGFAELPSRHALKGAWREELDRLMALLLLRLKA